MKTLRPLVFLVGFVLVVGLACSAFGGGGNPTPPPTQEQSPPVNNPTQPPPEPTDPPAQPTDALPPTDAPPPQPSALEFFTEEFDNPLSENWTPFYIYDENLSDLDKVTIETENGKLVWNLDTEWVYYYLFYNAFEYEDVQIEAIADNRGRNNNYVSLVCRYDPDVGWYEFNVANNGLYNILFAEVTDSGKIRYNRIANGGSNAIKQGKGVNEYLAVCQGNELSLEINGDEAISIREPNFALRTGQIGISVSSENVTPILIEMEWFKISEP